MALLRINATPKGLALHDTPQPAARRILSFASHPGPAIIMIHGYKYRPGSADHCPHVKIFGDAEHGWPAQLQFGKKPVHEGIGIALGWDARGALRDVYNRATEMGEHLAVIVAMLRQHSPHRPVHVIAHSLGSELALSALEHLPAHTINRMILLTGASYAERARHLLNTPAGRTVEVLNVTSRENDLFDLVFERLVPKATAQDQAIGLGIDAPNVTTVQLDCPETLQCFRRIGFDVAGPNRRICHWSAYTRPGVMQLYSAFLRNPAHLPLHRLARVLPTEAAPRWSRLIPHRPRLAYGAGLLRRHGFQLHLSQRQDALARPPENEVA